MKQSLLRDIVYSDIFMSINRRILSIFYDSRYLRGKFFEEQKYGFVWAWKCVFRSFFLKRRGIVWPISSQCRLASGKNMSVCPSSLNIFQQSCWIASDYTMPFKTMCNNRSRTHNSSIA